MSGRNTRQAKVAALRERMEALMVSARATAKGRRSAGGVRVNLACRSNIITAVQAGAESATQSASAEQVGEINQHR